MDNTQKTRSRRPWLERWRFDTFTWVLIAALAIVSITGALLAFNLVRNFIATWNLTHLEGVALSQPTPEVDLEIGEISGAAPEPMPDIRYSSWDKASRVTILVLGLDYRDWEAGSNYSRTDTMILVTFDPNTMTAGMLSLPRDLWVNIPGFDYGRINTAYFSGEAYKLPGGGPELAMRTVEEFMGVKVDYYAQIDFNTFVQFVDFLDGIRITVPENLKFENVPGMEKPLYLKKGTWVTLTGQQALTYIRHRKSGGGDFDRAQRQQQMLLALRKKLVEPYWQRRILENAPEMYNIFSQGIRTNMTFDELMALGLMAKDISVENIKSGVISPPEMVTLETMPDGQQVLKPITANIRKLRDEIFSSGSTVAPLAASSGDLATLMQQENASIAVFNGSSITGLAGATEAYLKSLGVNVTQSGNDELVPATTIYLYNAKPYTLKFLIEKMNIQSSRIMYANDPSQGVDIKVVVGNEWSVPAQ